MTGKRFTYHTDGCLMQWITDIKDGEIVSPKCATEWLNILYEENEQLKLQYSELEITLMNNQLAYNDLKEENDYYKSKCASLEEGYLKLQKEKGIVER